MKRAVITGMGIVSSLGNTADEVLSSLREGRSGISAKPAYTVLAMRSQVAGQPTIDLSEHIDRKTLRFM
ncbi:MAG: beta-ketoacyl synthase N-terminal-like domain-containing protein, partial [Pseudomonadota bacterium]